MSYHRHQFSDAESLAAFTASFLDGLLDQRDKAASSTGWTIEANGGWRKLIVANITVAAAGWNVYVLDASRDYRDRLWFASIPVDISAGTTRLLYPGHADDSRYNLATGVGGVAGRPYYTRLGYANPPGASLDNYFDMQGGTVPLVAWARDTDGALMVAANASGGISVGDSIAVMGMLYVSPVLNVRMSPTVPGTADAAFFDAVASGLIEPHDLNNLQDGQHMEQCPVGSSTIALGKVLRGNPPLPYEWTVRGATVRQPLLDPQLRRWVSFAAPANTVVTLDDDFDWRDRYITGVIWFSNTTDRRPGQAGDTLNGTGAVGDVETREIAAYTRGGMNLNFPGLIEGQLEVDTSTGVLRWNNNTATAIVGANMMLFASPRLGPRSIGLPSPRLLDDPSLGKVSGVLVDSATTLDGVIARYRMDRGIMLDGGKVAVIADQSGNGHHLRQLDPALRATAPATRALLNSQLAIPLTGVEYYDSVKALPPSSAGYYVGMIVEPSSLAIPDFQPWELLLPLATEGQISSLISGSTIVGQWVPDAVSTPPYMFEETTAYATSNGFALCWRFNPSSVRLVPSLFVRPAGSGGTAGLLVSESPLGVGASDVQELVWRLFAGFRGHVAEVIICKAPQSNANAFAVSADIVSRYAL